MNLIQSKLASVIGVLICGVATGTSALAQSSTGNTSSPFTPWFTAFFCPHVGKRLWDFTPNSHHLYFQAVLYTKKAFYEQANFDSAGSDILFTWPNICRFPGDTGYGPCSRCPGRRVNADTTVRVALFFPRERRSKAIIRQSTSITQGDGSWYC